MAKSVYIVLLLVACVAASADEYHRSAVRSRRNAPTTGEPANPIRSSTRRANEISEEVPVVDVEEVNIGPPYEQDEEPCEEEDDIRNFILEHNRTKRKRCSLEGVWYNEVGSEMVLNVTSEGQIRGEYRTAVEIGYGSAGEGSSRISGFFNPEDSNPVFGLTVIWNAGESVTSWTGQCLMCDAKETLETTWVLSTKVESMADSCHYKWNADRIGQNTFTRKEQRFGPRKALDTHTPRDFWNVPRAGLP